jgi:hypothetical protein
MLLHDNHDTQTSMTPRPKKFTTPCCPDFLDLKLKAVELYGHDTLCFVFKLPNSVVELLPVTSLILVHTFKGANGMPSPLPVAHSCEFVYLPHNLGY